MHSMFKIKLECPTCHEKVSDNDLDCPYCGTRFDDWEDMEDWTEFHSDDDFE